jgi:hypothetical protein
LIRGLKTPATLSPVLNTRAMHLTHSMVKLNEGADRLAKTGGLLCSSYSSATDNADVLHVLREAGRVNNFLEDGDPSSFCNVDDEHLATVILSLKAPFWMLSDMDSLICPEKDVMTTTWFALDHVFSV